MGYDVHPFSTERKLVLGGQDIPFHKGLSGWSDADALIHAVIEAMLGAAAMGDIGQHFPPGDPTYKDISSMVLLRETTDKLYARGWRVNNIDATIVTEAPRLTEYIEAMRRAISHILNIDVDQVSIKPKTSGRLGFIGRGEGIAAYAVVLIESK